ncbi:hypothetical protein LMIY3S_03144 [Labrys miyagiensis]
MAVLLLAAAVAGVIAGAKWHGADDGAIYTLYRSVAQSEVGRVHVATFDAVEGEAYNQGNCQAAAQLFLAQPGVTTKFWCEKGRFRS